MSAPPYPTARTTHQGGLLSEFIKPVHVTLTKNTKGYGWEVSIHGDDTEEVLRDVEKVEAELKRKYGGEDV
ncbi:MAG: hypothetical protein ACREQ5_06080 [Candidatus Dormibacteria bacterium]